MRRAIGALAALILLSACTSGNAHPAPSTSAARPSSGLSARVVPVPNLSSLPAVPSPLSPSTSLLSPPPSAPTSPRTTPPAATLPLRYSTADAGQVITVVARSAGSTTATLRAWQRAGAVWTPVGPAVTAWLGTEGVGRASEQTTTTPAGSFSLTQAFGRDRNPGTRLPYFQTDPADWWISQSGPLYNTHQHCAANCLFTQGAPNEHLYYETPYYDYAVVIDYNRSPVVQGAGSAFFLHVTVGAPTQGCVSIAADQLVRIMRWLNPAQHPRILIGVG